MSKYDDFLNGSDIPTVRRLDYIVKDTDPMESGYLYAALRNLEMLTEFNDDRSSLSEAHAAEFEEMKEYIAPKMEWVNEWMRTNGKDPFFTDPQDWRAVGADYDYFWRLRTKKKFIEEEVAARTGKSGRKPIQGIDEKYSEIIEGLIREQGANDRSIE